MRGEGGWLPNITCAGLHTERPVHGTTRGTINNLYNELYTVQCTHTRERPIDDKSYPTAVIADELSRPPLNQVNPIDALAILPHLRYVYYL